MFTNVNFIARGLVVSIFLLYALPAVVRSQEERVTVTPDTSIAEVEEEDVTPYKLEKLEGDKVFGDFVLGPGKIELGMSPGETKIVNLNVSNRIGESKQFNIEIEDMTGSNSPTQPVVLLGDDIGPYTIKDYISIPDSQFILEHNKRAIVPVTISIPEDAEPGGHYGSVLVNTVTVEAQRADAETNTAPASAIVSRIGTLLFITVSGDLDQQGMLRDFAAKNSKKWYEKGPVDLQILYENTGSVHLNPYGELRITNMLGDEVGYVEIDPWFTLPNSVRLREISWNRDMLYGKYTATLELNRGYNDVVDTSSVTFWVIPWKIVLIILAILYFVFFFLRSFFKKFEFKKKE